MIERIKELLPTPWTYPYPDRELYTKEQMIHMAELVVKECAEMIRQSEKANWLDAAQMAKDIEKLFGIKP